nr:ABC transporter ATP-binding protein [Pseudomonas sp. PA27(2017)]
MNSAGSQASALRRALLTLTCAALLQGLALSCLLPLLPAALAGDWPLAAIWLTLMTLLTASSLGLRWWAQGFDYSGNMALACHELRVRLGQQLRRVPLQHLQHKRAGELNATLLGNVDENLNYVLTVSNLIVCAVFTPLVAALALFFADWRLGLAMLVLFPALIPFYRLQRSGFGASMQRLDRSHQRTSATIIEYLQGLPSLRAACQTGTRNAELQASLRDLQQVQTDDQRSALLPKLLTSSLVELGLLAVAGLGIHWVLQGDLSVPVLAATLIIIARTADALSAFITYTAVFDLIEAALQRIEALLALQPLPQQPLDTVPGSQGIVFEDVEFAYPGSRDTGVSAINAVFAPGTVTALVGPSGSGKSTLTRLIMRHYDVEGGRILIDGKDLRSLDSTQLAAHLSVVFQDVYLFDDSVLENMRLARPQASDEQILAALQAAQCMPFIERLEQGWHTQLGEGASRLSGGERQRLSIARALLKDAPILILDEPTASLDSENEQAVQRAIDALVKERTVIVIAHRLHSIVGADHILVMEQGRIVQQGTHSQLCQLPGRYRNLWQAQEQVKHWHYPETHAFD